jgi:hypothetical protein
MAFLAMGMVMLLSLSAVSPELHEWLHKKESAKHTCSHTHTSADSTSHAPDSNGDASHQCAVTLFSHGVVHHAVALHVQPSEGILRAVNLRAFERLALAQPRFLHLPPQAPPAV